MHVLPLPFGLALALIPRREADRIRPRGPVAYIANRERPMRERVLGDLRYFNSRRYTI
jgi:hypothetical protein